jgi:sodium pump decarboxylase gamma subunit
MILLDITADTWLVTGLGFGIVLILLFCFIYIMKLLGWIMQPKEKKQEAVAEPAAKPVAANNDNDLVAVAYTLHLYYNSLHDAESPRLTVKNHTTAWHIIQ